MSYGTIVKELARILGDRIIAYDNLPDHCGCILYVSGPVKRIEIEVLALEEGASDVAAFVRQILASPPEKSRRVGIGLRDGKLSLLTDSLEAEQTKTPAEANA